MRFCSSIFWHRQSLFFLTLMLLQCVALQTGLVQGGFAYAAEVGGFELKTTDNNLQVVIQTDKRAQYAVEHSGKGMSVILNESSLPAGTPRTKTFTLPNGKKVQGTLIPTGAGQVRLALPGVSSKDYAVSVLQQVDKAPAKSVAPAVTVPSSELPSQAPSQVAPKPRTSAFNQGYDNESDLLDAIVKRFQSDPASSKQPAQAANKPQSASKASKTVVKTPAKAVAKQPTKPAVKPVTPPEAKEPIAALAVGGPEVAATPKKTKTTSKPTAKAKSTLAQDLSKSQAQSQLQAQSSGHNEDLSRSALFKSTAPATTSKKSVASAATVAASASAPVVPLSNVRKPAATSLEQELNTGDTGAETTTELPLTPAEPTREMNPPEATTSENLSTDPAALTPDEANVTALDLSGPGEPPVPSASGPSIWEQWVMWTASFLTEIPGWMIGVMGFFLILASLTGGTLAIRGLLRQLNHQMDDDDRILPMDFYAPPEMSQARVNPYTETNPYTGPQVQPTLGAQPNPDMRVPSSLGAGIGADPAMEPDLDFGLSAVQSSFGVQGRPFQDKARVNASQYLMGNHRDMRQAVRTTMQLKYATRPPSQFQ